MILIALFLFAVFAIMVTAVVIGIIVLAVRSGHMKIPEGPTSPGPGKTLCPGSGNHGYGQYGEGAGDPFSTHQRFTDFMVRCQACGKVVSCNADGRVTNHYR